MTSVQLLNISHNDAVEGKDPSKSLESCNTFRFGEESTPEDNCDTRMYKQLGALYKYTPTKYIPRLRLFDNNSVNARLKAIIRKRSLIVIMETRGNWNYIIIREFEGWCQFSLRDEKIREALQPVEEYRRYWEWQGDDVFCCNGKVMIGSDFNFFIFSNILFLSVTLVYLVLVVPFMYEPETCTVSASRTLVTDMLTHSYSCRC